MSMSMKFLLALLACRRCGREEYLDFPSGDCFYCCGERMRKESVCEEEDA